MKTLAVFLVLVTSSVFADTGPNIKISCYHDRRLAYSLAEPTAALCANVTSEEDITNVITCYVDERIRYMDSFPSAILCSSVKSKADIEKVIGCFQKEGGANFWEAILKCK